jgi:hypothetical protein
MNTHKSKENKNDIIANSPSQKQKVNTFQFADNRPEAVLQAKLQEMANNQFSKPIQKQELEKEKLLQGKFETVQKQELEEDELL